MTVLSIEMSAGAPSQASLPVGASKFQGCPQPTLLLGGQVATGGVRSSTATDWLHCIWVPQASVADQVRTAMNELPQTRLVTVLTICTTTPPPVTVG